MQEQFRASNGRIIIEDVKCGVPRNSGDREGSFGHDGKGGAVAALCQVIAPSSLAHGG